MFQNVNQKKKSSMSYVRQSGGITKHFEEHYNTTEQHESYLMLMGWNSASDTFNIK